MGSLVMSTGVIGQRLPIDRVVGSIPVLFDNLRNDFDAWTNASKAFMTTDTFPKLRSRSWTSSDGKKRSVLGIVKGAGMMHPSLVTSGLSSASVNKKQLHATLLGVFLTDAPVPSSLLRQVLDGGIRGSFNNISVDGDTSTNDSILLLANGASGGAAFREGSEDELLFRNNLEEIMLEMAKLVVRDGEGATKLIKVSVENWNSAEEAHAIAKAIAISPLVKTAIYGRDANWGRILCAVGNSRTGTTPDIDRISVSLVSGVEGGGRRRVEMLRKGQPTDWSEEEAKLLLEEEEVEIRVDMGVGSQSGCYWTCDLTHEYISINADYRS
ncbi:DmpA/ArgJ-like protein [Atractiella rhizophila]|nr:DmpA/ArgJ-like protein [Atractiella rhizophila]